MTDQQRFEQMIHAFSKAFALIEQGKVRQARKLIFSLPETVYEKALRWYKSKMLDYYYYLIRYVLDTFEKESKYCYKPKIKEKIAFYHQMTNALSINKPLFVRSEQKLIILNQLSLFAA